jgi:uncharacterized caspase-like protein
MDKNYIYKPEYSNSWALVIGINKYLFCSPLNYATNDAEAIAKVLEERFGFPKKNIILLLDKEATQKSIRRSFVRYADEKLIGPNDRILVFFAGHGTTLKGNRGEVGFLVPVNGKLENIDTLIRWDEFTRNADLIPAKHIFFLMDACYGGLVLVRQPAFGSMRFLKDMLQRISRQVLTAGKADETVADGSGVRPGHSIFTAHLLNALEGKASTSDGIISASGVMAYVYDQVGRDQYSHQTPHYGFIDGDGDFIFDTSILEKLKSTKEEENKKGKDILLNTSPQIAPIHETDISVVDAIKELISDPSQKIKLDDYVSNHIRHFLDVTDLRHFPVQTPSVSKEDFLDRIQRYEDLTKDLENISILLAQWGNSDQLLLLEKIFTRVVEADRGSSGTVLWLRLGWYPVLLLMYTAGIAALSKRKYEALKIILGTQVHPGSEYGEKITPVIVPVVNNLKDLHDNFKLLPGYERHYVPRSEHLFKSLQPSLEDLLFLGRSYESLFDRFEIFLALIYADTTDRGWGPPGRFAWKYSKMLSSENPFTELIEEAKKDSDTWAPLKTGFFQGSYKRFQEIADSYKGILDQLGWW